MDWFKYEKDYQKQGYSLICGIDEAGRGPLFGPVCAAAVILPEAAAFSGLNDSKKLSAKKREFLYEEITAQALSYGVGFASAQEIDDMNILQATYLAMHRAYAQLCPKPDFILIDGNKIPTQLQQLPAAAIVKGDTKSASIAAASILAKVSRDRRLREYAEAYPDYGFERHKGYPTKAHYAAIKAYGILKEHRKSFLRNLGEK